MGPDRGLCISSCLLATLHIVGVGTDEHCGPFQARPFYDPMDLYVSPWGDLWVPIRNCGGLCISVCLLATLHIGGSWNWVSIVVLFKLGYSMILWVSMCPCGGSVGPYGDLWGSMGPFECLGDPTHSRGLELMSTVVLFNLGHDTIFRYWFLFLWEWGKTMGRKRLGSSPPPPLGTPGSIHNPCLLPQTLWASSSSAGHTNTSRTTGRCVGLPSLSLLLPHCGAALVGSLAGITSSSLRSPSSAGGTSSSSWCRHILVLGAPHVYCGS